jgi:hypothetical protein
MNVLILTPDRVGSTLLQRVLTVYMLRQGFDKPVINLHELTNGLEKYYNETLNQEVLGKPRGTDWGYYQTLEEVETLLKSADHYKTSRLAHYHILYRKDTIKDQIKFYEYLNKNFFIISCRRENLFDHALSWGIQGHSKRLNVYNVEEKINVFHDIYKNKITIAKETLVRYLNNYKNYIDWADTNFNIQSYWNYDTDVKNIEKYILNLDFMNNDTNNTWKEMFGQDFNTWNACHRILPNLKLLDRPEATNKLKILTKPITEEIWNQHKGLDWPQTAAEYVSSQHNLPVVVENEIKELFNETTLNVTAEEYSFLEKNLSLYMNTNIQLLQLVSDGFLVTGIPLKLQSLKEKKLIIKNFDQCIEWYNEWSKENNFGATYTDSELSSIMTDQDSELIFQVDQRNLLQ